MRKLFNRWTPTPESLQQHPRLKFFLAGAAHPRLWRLTRRGVALGAAIGAAVCVIPLPIQVLLAGFLAFFFKAHIPTAVAATFISNPLTAFLVWGAAWKMGSLLLQQPATALPSTDFSFGRMSWQQFDMWINWLSANGQPLLIGMPLLATILAIFFYLLVMLGWRIAVSRQWRQRKT
ncbi:MAG: hypothetical protein RL020_1810 [Pseudomonadota bacterium]|jgi:uncharacterized protein